MKKRKAFIAVIAFAAILTAIVYFTRPAEPAVSVGMDRNEVLASFTRLADSPRRRLVIDEGHRFYAFSRDYWIGRYELCVTYGDNFKVKKVWKRWRWRWNP